MNETLTTSGKFLLITQQLDPNRAIVATLNSIFTYCAFGKYYPVFSFMYTVTYYKIGPRWYLDFPEHLENGGDPEDLEKIGGFHEFLQLACEGKDTVVFLMDTEPFEGADKFCLTETVGEQTGGYYHLSAYQGKEVDLELWFAILSYLNQTELPKALYLKRTGFIASGDD